MIAVIYFDGNSLTQSRGGVPPYPSLIDLSQVPSANVAVGGSTTPQQDERAVTSIDADQRAGNRWVVFWEGANDLYFGASAQDTISHLIDYCANRHKAGFRVALLTLLPRSDAGLPPTYETNRQIVNDWLRDNCCHRIADALVDVALDSHMGHAGQEFDERYFLPDRVHLNLAGAQTIAGYVAVALYAEQGK